MEVSGKKHSEVKGVNPCSFCEDFDITTCADGFCVECEVCICLKCFVQHKGRRINQEHSLVKVGESNSVKTTDTFDVCQQHNVELVKHYCPTHDQVCCGECIVLYHNGCKLELVRDKAYAFRDSKYLDDLRRDIKTSIQQAKASTSLADDRTLLSDIYEQFVREVNTFVNQLIDHLKLLRIITLNKGKDIMSKDARRMDALDKEIDEFITKVSQQNQQLEDKRDQPKKLFVASISLKTELKTSQQHLDLLKKKNTVTHYTFKPDKILENFLKENALIGVLQEYPEEVNQPDMEADQTIEAGDTYGQILQDQLTELYNRTDIDQCESKRDNILDDSDEKSKHMLGIENKKDNEAGQQLQTINASSWLDREPLCKNLNVNGQMLRLYSGGFYKGKHGDGWQIGDRVGCKKTRCLKGWSIVFTHNGKDNGYYYQLPEGDHFAVGMKCKGDKVKMLRDLPFEH